MISFLFFKGHPQTNKRWLKKNVMIKLSSSTQQSVKRKDSV